MMVDRPHLSLVASVRPDLAAQMPQLMSLSEGSLVVRAHELLEPGQKARVTIHLIDSGQDVEIDVEVVWANHKLGDMALRFEALGEEGQAAIAAHIAKRAARR